MTAQALHSIDDVIASMQRRFQPDAAKDIQATYQWRIKGKSGSPDRNFAVLVNKGSFEIKDGLVEKADTTFDIDEDSYLRMVNGQLKGMVAVLTRKLQISGNIFLGSKMDSFFK